MELTQEAGGRQGFILSAWLRSLWKSTTCAWVYWRYKEHMLLAKSLRQEWLRTPIPIPKIDRIDKVGPDTTQLLLNSMIPGLIFPDSVTKAYEGLDRVVSDRMPTFEDSPNLPYIRAMVKSSQVEGRDEQRNHSRLYGT